MGIPILAVIGSVLVGGVVAIVAVVGVVSSVTSPSDQSPADVSQPVTIDYGSNS